MAFLSASKKTHFTRSLSNLSSPLSLKSHFFFSTQTLNPNPETPNADSSSPLPPPPAPHRELRRKKPTEKLESTICKMMSSRAWTTRLQNSIRSLVPSFDHELVYNVLDSARNSEHALQFFRWVERSNLFKHNKETHHKIIEILARSSKLNHARLILLDMPNKGLEWDEDSWVSLIEGYGSKGIVQESVKLFNKMEELGVKRGVKSYDALFRVITRRGRYMMAKRYYNKMLAEGVEPSLHTFNVLIWGFFLCGRVATAVRFYEDMKGRGISPDVVTYNTLISGFFRAKTIEEAERFFVEMKEREIKPNVVTYTGLIKGYVSVVRIDDALRLVEEMKGCGIKLNAVTYSTLLPGLCEGEKMSEASSVFKEMVDQYIAPTDNSIFMRLIDGQCNAGNLDAAVDVLKGMNKLSIPAEAGHYGVLIENLCKAGEYDRAVKLLDKLIKKEIILKPESTLKMEASAYNPLIEYMCNNGQTGKAETLTRQLMKLGVQDSTALNALIRGHSIEGTPESATELLKIMQRRKFDPEQSTFVTLVESYLKKNEPADAKAALDSMIENGHLPESSLYRLVMESLFNDGRVQTASRVMKTMLEKGVTENEDLIAKILEALFVRGHVEEALGRIELLMQSGIEPNFDQLVTILCEKGKTTAALKLMDYGLERDYSIDVSSYEKVLDALLESGKTLNAYSILCKILQKGGVADWSKSCKELIKSLNEEGNTKQADILSRMILGNEKLAAGKKGMKKAVKA